MQNHPYLDLAPIIAVNGKILKPNESAVALSAFDRGFLLADGAFETLQVPIKINSQTTESIPTCDLEILWWHEHWQRLNQALALLDIPNYWHINNQSNQLSVMAENTWQELKNLASNQWRQLLLAVTSSPSAILRITISRGTTQKRGLWLEQNPEPTLVMCLYPPAAANRLIPKKVMLLDFPMRISLAPWNQYKIIGNYSQQVIGAKIANANNYDDIILTNEKGEWVSGLTGNIFVKIANEWHTPSLSSGAVAGIARKKLLQLTKTAHQQNCKFQESIITTKQLPTITSAFFSNSLGFLPIAKIQEKPLTETEVLLNQELPIWQDLIFNNS